MRFGVLLSVYVSLATMSFSNGGEFSHVRDLPALKMGATDLDGILLETNAFIAAVNGSEDSGWDIVKLTIDDQNIEIPHLSLASSVAFPNEVFRFSYTYQQANKPVSSVTIDLGDSLRRVSVSGESADQVEVLSKLLEKDFRRYATAAGGLKFRRVTGVCLSMLCLHLADDQQHVLLEKSKPQRVGNSDLFCNRFFASAARAMEQICSRLRSLSALFPLFSHQACA